MSKLKDYVISGSRKLRKGVTTGSCAAGAAKAATILLLSGEAVEMVSFHTKNGTPLTLDCFVDDYIATEQAGCFVLKDAGDDPDVTDGIKIMATVSKISSGIEIDGGYGIGRVTRKGLKTPVGFAAINPVPLEMIEKEVMSVAKGYNYTGGLRIVISAPDGMGIAKRTMNERLGIVGGISILGTTGIVEPMSEKAIVDTIKTEIDVHISEGRGNLLVTPGNYSRDFAMNMLGLNIDDAVKCSNFIGETLDYAVYCGVKEMTLIGHAGKLVKVAGGIMNTHSSIADCRMEIIAAHSAMAGASSEIISQIMDCITVDAAIETLGKGAIYNRVLCSLGKKIGFHIRERTKGDMQVRYIVFTQEYGILIDSQT